MSLYTTHKGHTMLTSIIAYLNNMFKQSNTNTYGSELEQYIVSKCPTSAAEIDHWTKQFDHTRNTKGWL